MGQRQKRSSSSSRAIEDAMEGPAHSHPIGLGLWAYLKLKLPPIKLSKRVSVMALAGCDLLWTNITVGSEGLSVFPSFFLHLQVTNPAAYLHLRRRFQNADRMQLVMKVRFCFVLFCCYLKCCEVVCIA